MLSPFSHDKGPKLIRGTTKTSLSEIQRSSRRNQQGWLAAGYKNGLFAGNMQLKH
jgi:hypothetical protein